MRGGWRVAAAVFAAAWEGVIGPVVSSAAPGGAPDIDSAMIAAQMSAARAAHAQLPPSSPPARPISDAERQAQLLLFSGADFWRKGAFGYGGLLWARSGLDREGMVIKLVFGSGAYRYASGALGNIEVTGQQIGGSILPGWRFVRDKLTATVFLGADFQRHRLTPDDPSASLHGSYTGVRTGFELWYEPTSTTMVAADGSVSSIGASYNARLATGWRVLDRLYVGPEVQGFAAGDNYRQIRVGVHFTGLRAGRFEWSTGFGFAEDSDHRSGAYGRLSVFTRR